MMRFAVGQSDGNTTVYVVQGDQAFDLTSILPEVGGDLSALAANADLRDKASALTDLGVGIPVADIEFFPRMNSAG